MLSQVCLLFLLHCYQDLVLDYFWKCHLCYLIQCWESNLSCYGRRAWNWAFIGCTQNSCYDLFRVCCGEENTFTWDISLFSYQVSAFILHNIIFSIVRILLIKFACSFNLIFNLFSLAVFSFCSVDISLSRFSNSCVIYMHESSCSDDPLSERFSFW